MNCAYCNKPLILLPSAAERIKTSGGKHNNHTAMFTTHNQCQIDMRREDACPLMQKTTFVHNDDC